MDTGTDQVDLIVEGEAGGNSEAVPVKLVRPDGLEDVLGALSATQRAWAEAHGFDGSEGKHLMVPDDDGAIACALFGLGAADSSRANPFAAGKLPTLLPAGTYRYEDTEEDLRIATLAWVLGAYSFDQYRKKPRAARSLLVPESAETEEIRCIADGVYLTRDLVNTPANDMGPDELEAAVRRLAGVHKAKVQVIKGEALLTKNFPMIHAVGRASDRVPRLIDMTWGRARDPRITLVGKGVCFDTGGLNIKPGNSMALMKKDMGGLPMFWASPQ